MLLLSAFERRWWFERDERSLFVAVVVTAPFDVAVVVTGTETPESALSVFEETFAVLSFVWVDARFAAITLSHLVVSPPPLVLSIVDVLFLFDGFFLIDTSTF